MHWMLEVILPAGYHFFLIDEMHDAHIPSGLDFLLVFEAVLTHGTITKAAEHLGVSQSALSHTLVRLRSHFGDPLFVRAGGVMKPTPLVLGITEPLRRSLTIIRGEILGARRFDPKTSQRLFKICVSEVGAFLLVPRLLKVLSKRAPGASLAPMEVPRAEIPSALESGAVDLAIGHFPELKSSLFQQNLFVRSYSAIVAKSHPTVGARMTARQFQQIPIVRCNSTVAINQWLDAYFAKSGPAPATALETPYLMALATIVGATQWVAFVPDELLEPMQRLASIRAVEVPAAVPRLAVKQYWHRRYKDDEANRFLRALVYEALHE